MKKIFMILSAAALVLAGCTKIETVKVDENRTIGFSTFVGKPTKAATEIVGVGGTNGLTKFYVFGNYGNNSGGSYDNEVFDNQEFKGSTSSNFTTGTSKYWITGKFYKFAAYSNGNNKIDNITGTTRVSFGEDGNITFTAYQAGTSDLILATPDEVECKNASNQGAVNLTFRHLLSQVSFQFTNGFASGYTVEISDLKFTVKNQGDYIQGSWDPESLAVDYEKSIAGPLEIPSDAPQSIGAWFVIPQGNTSYNVKFNAKVKDANGTIVSEKEELTASLRTGDLSTAGNETWVSGFKYRYTAEINEKVMSLDGKEIEFIVVDVVPWTNAGDSELKLP